MTRPLSESAVLATRFLYEAMFPYLVARSPDDVTPTEFAALISGFNAGREDSVSVVHLDVILWEKLESSEFSSDPAEQAVKLLVQARRLTQQTLKFPVPIIAPTVQP